MVKLGMDFGSTYTIVSVFREDTGILEVLSLGEGLPPNIPSVVAKGKGEVFIGFSAKNKTGKKGYTVYKAFKMLLAVTDPGKLAERGYDEENNPEEITRIFIEGVLSQVLESLHETRIDKLVVGVPEIWNSSLETLGGKAMLRDICKSLDFVDSDGVKVVSEPAAASAYFAHNYALNTKQNFEGCILLVDYGGGTLDITLSKVMTSDDENGVNSMELKVLERKGAGENEEGRVGEAGIVYMETVMDWAIRRSGLTDGEAPEYDGKFYRAVDDLEMELQTSMKRIQNVFEEYGLDYLDELNEEEFAEIEYGREDVSVSFGLLLEVYNQVIWGVFDRKMDEIMNYMDENNIRYMDGSRNDFKIALVGGFGNFYLVRKQIQDKFKLGHNDKRQESIIADKSGCERAVSLGAALLAADVIGIRSTADFSIGMWAYDIDKRICMNYAIRYKQEIEVNKVYYARSSIDGEVFVIQAISGGFDKFLINLGSDDKLANFGLLKEKFAKKLSNVVTNQYHTAVVGFSLDPSNVVSVHVRDYDLMKGRISDDDHVIELTKFNDLFEVATVGPLPR